VNALGYRLLGAGAADRAIAAFRINTRVYPRSANTFDSLGEALFTAGHREEAIASYRHALEIEPGFPPSVQALERLGVR
jgi:tetratricopeptide (TPR) repeat protein